MAKEGGPNGQATPNFIFLFFLFFYEKNQGRGHLYQVSNFNWFTC